MTSTAIEKVGPASLPVGQWPREDVEALVEALQSAQGIVPIEQQIVFVLMCYGQVYFEEKALVMHEALSYDEYLTIGKVLQFAERNIHWWIGDWIKFGEAKAEWGEMYTQALELTPYSLSTLQNDVWVAKRFPKGSRRWELSFRHYSDIAGLYGSDPENAAKILDEAVEKNWTTQELRNARDRYRAWIRGSDYDHVELERACGSVVERLKKFPHDQWPTLLWNYLMSELADMSRGIVAKLARFGGTQ